MHDFLGIGPRIMDIHFDSELLEFGDDIDYFSVADVGAVFFEGYAEDEHFSTFHFLVFRYHQLDDL